MIAGLPFKPVGLKSSPLRFLWALAGGAVHVKVQAATCCIGDLQGC